MIVLPDCPEDLIRKNRVWTTLNPTQTQPIYISDEKDSSTSGMALDSSH